MLPFKQRRKQPMPNLADVGLSRPQDDFHVIQCTKTWRAILIDDFVRLFLTALYRQGKLPIDVTGDPEPWLAEWSVEVISQYDEQCGFAFGDASATLVLARCLAHDFVKSTLTLGEECVPLFTGQSDDRAAIALRLGEILDSRDTYINLGA